MTVSDLLVGFFEGDFQFVDAVVREPSSMRGAWLVGPMNMPQKR